MGDPPDNNNLEMRNVRDDKSDDSDFMEDTEAEDGDRSKSETSLEDEDKMDYENKALE